MDIKENKEEDLLIDMDTKKEDDGIYYLTNVWHTNEQPKNKNAIKRGKKYLSESIDKAINEMKIDQWLTYDKEKFTIEDLKITHFEEIGKDKDKKRSNNKVRFELHAHLLYYIKGKGNAKPIINHKDQLNWARKNTNFKHASIEKHVDKYNSVKDLKHTEQYNSKDKNLSDEDIWNRILNLSEGCDGPWKNNLQL